MREAVYAGDDYLVTPSGLRPYDDGLEFLTWPHVEATHALVVSRQRTAAFRNPPGTVLHEDKPLARKVDDHFRNYGSSVKDAADHYEEIVRHADPWNVTYGQGWYQHEAGHAVQRLYKLGYTRHQAAHLIADLSPQNPWLGTINRPEMGNREESVRYGRECQDMVNRRGKYDSGKLTITDDDLAAAHERWGKDVRIRAGRYDISHPDPRQWGVSPREMAELAPFHSRATRTVRANAIATALKVRHPDELGPKTYPFHDNIMDPFSSPYVAVDTWVVDASGIHLPRSARPGFLSSKEGARGHDIPVYRGLGQVGLASAVISATHSLNKDLPTSMRGHRPLQPLHTQAIVWVEHQWRNNPKFRKIMEPMRSKPWDEVFGYNFGHPHA